jgi:hypothetical protein
MTFDLHPVQVNSRGWALCIGNLAAWPLPPIRRLVEYEMGLEGTQYMVLLTFAVATIRSCSNRRRPSTT